MKVVKRRRRQGKTDYNARLSMLKSGLPRIIFRKTNRYIIGQYVKSQESKDKVIIGVTSKDLIESGWPKQLEGSLKSIPASYLTGFLLGKKIIDREDKVRAILDIGLIRNVPGSRMQAFLKGVQDSGVGINAKKENFPNESRLLGRHMKKEISFNKIKEKIEND
jgi:large subunit ribosomal protein L18